MSTPMPPPGWYQDPTSPGLRWWDGNRWTEHHQAAVAMPPPPAYPAPGAPGAPGMPGAPTPAPVQPKFQQKWWHIPLLVALGVFSTVGWIVIQLLA